MLIYCDSNSVTYPLLTEVVKIIINYICIFFTTERLIYFLFVSTLNFSRNAFVPVSFVTSANEIYFSIM